MQSFLADFLARSGSRVRTLVLGKNGQNFAQKLGTRKVALADHDAVTIAVIESHFSFVPHSELQESRNQWEFQSGTNEK